MTHRERFRRTLAFEPADRLPVTEWAGWWDKTIARWRSEGLPEDVRSSLEIRDYFGLDRHVQIHMPPRHEDCPRAPHHGAGIMRDRADYRELKKHLYPDPAFNHEAVAAYAREQEAGDLAVWATLEGFFWFPRTMFGIERHLYAFYDQPDLMREMCADLVEFYLRAWDEFCAVCVPDFMTFAEDMSYNHGPMLSRAMFDDFLAPCYERVAPGLRERGTVVILDSDGDVDDAVAWYLGTGIQGFLPLERMAGVDIARLREKHPTLRMVGAFDKTVMHRGEARMRQEFERLLPVMRQGGYIPGCDHQTPPEVSMADYRLYLRLLREYCEKATG